jgi:pimeloyl-ACP methyl ester carboxylesterase
MRVDSTDGVELEVHDLGGDGPPLLLAHATGFHGLVWEPLASHLTGYRRFSIDMRAHGDSTAPLRRSLEWDGFADDVLAVVDALGLESPFAVGHSKGGAALLLAEQRRPGTFRSLYCWEPVVMPPEIAIGYQPDNPLSNGARRRRPTFASHDEAFENYALKPPFSGLDAAALRAYVDHGFAITDDGTVTLKCLPENEAEVYAHGTAHQAFRSLALVRCSVTIAVGVEDTVPAIFGRSIAAALPDGRIESHPELGHFGPLENPPTVAASILAAFALG